ncbi:hypothetical protein C3K47_07760 [Solitalea longa]|uniref:Uncharacterized protein n=1 Tax=Solitalea longa TaxID=2079460 RepID=A0A2S5A2Z7_9SPHI|nr:hypothetical protein [Solitalea longa]POY36951.1 hypothetical protein C3K47_07760 [Solitalea longa]
METKSTLFMKIKTVGLLSIVLLATSCSNELKFVKVKSTEPVYVRTTEAVQIEAQSTETRAQETENTEALVSNVTPDGAAQATESLTGQQTTSTRQLVRSEMSKNVAFNKLSASQQEKVEKLITKRVDKVVAKKKAAPAPAPNVQFTRIMLIGLIILLAGIILGAIVGGLGWIAFVVGLGLIVYGLIVQL